MENIYYEKVLNRIFQGRLRVKLGDLVLFIYEPTVEIIEESFDIYEEIKKTAYFSGIYTTSEILELLITKDLWSPLDDREAEKIGKEIEDLKVAAYESFLDKKRLKQIKRQIESKTKHMSYLLMKKVQLDHIGCEGVATFARSSWIIENCTHDESGKVYRGTEIDTRKLLEIYNKNSIDQETFRKIARSRPFRDMWSSCKNGSEVFGVASIRLDANQLTLVSYSQMYDNVFESPDCPNDKVVEDDICLDGWFIKQRRDSDQQKKEQQVNDSIKNEKIANSQEVFVMASSQEHAQDIYGLNSPQNRQVIKGRQQQLKDAKGERVKLADLHDVKQGLQMDAVNAGRDAIKRR